MLFVWGVADDDPDGGLVAHTGPDVDSPVTRVLAPNAVALRPTGGCAFAPNGAPWFELYDSFTGSFDWVNARYLAPASPACLHGEAFGSATRAGVTDGTAAMQLFGPLAGVAIAEGERVAFYPGTVASLALDTGDHLANVLTFRWFPADAITIDVPCFLEGPTGPVCLSGNVVLFDFLDPEPRINDGLPLEAARTGRLYARPPERGLRDEFVEVTIDGDPGRYWYDPAVTRSDPGPCSADSGASFDTLPCTVADVGDPTSELSGGSAPSDADHVHNLTTSIDGASGCVRVVIELGAGVWSDDDRPANALPPITATRSATSTWIEFGSCSPAGDCDIVGTSFDEPHDVSVAGFGVRAFVARSDRSGIQLLHPAAATNVTFQDNPARIVVDVFPEPDAERTWYGTSTIIAERLPANVSADEAITVRGWGRPFEAQGQWRIYRVDGAQAPLDDTPPESLDLVETGLMMTSDWTTAAGEFEVTLPPLAPGLYAVLFGETPPGGDDDILRFIAAGQIIRIYDAGVDPATLPPISAEVWDEITLTDE